MSLIEARMPMRHPNTKASAVMQRRGWWLVILGFLLPGSAQVLAGSRRLGRFGIGATLTLAVALAAAAALWSWWRPPLLALIGNSVGLFAMQLALIAYALLWLVLGLDTLRLARLNKVPGWPKAGIAMLAVAATAAPVALAGYGAAIVDSSRNLVSEVFEAAGPAVEPIDGRYTFLLLGADAGDGREGLRPDSMTVVTVNAETGAATMIGVPRNLRNAPFSEGSPMWGPWPNGFNCETSDCLLNGAYTYGEGNPELYPQAAETGSSPGIEATRDAVEGVTGLELQFYVLVDMQGFVDLIDALGGLEITATERVPIAIEGEPVRDWIEPGTQVLNGHDSLWYGRSRAGANDYARMARQREVQQAIIKGFTPETLLLKFRELAAAGQDMVDTDIPQSMIPPLSDTALKTRALPMTTLELVPESGVNTSAPDFDQVHAMVQAALAEADAVTPPSEAPAP